MGNMTMPLYRKVYDELLSRIRSEEYPRETALPSEAKLVEEFGVSLITIRRAIYELALDGLVESRQGLGNFVCDPVQSAVIVGMSSFTSDVASGRLRLVRTLMWDDMVTADAELADKLGVQPGSMLRHMVRLDCEGGMPFSVDEAYVPPAFAARITHEIAASVLFMHLWQEAAGIELVRTDYDIRVEIPGERDRQLLQIGPEVPLLVTGELLFDRQDRPRGYIVTRYRGDRSRLSGTVTLVQKKTEKGIIGE